MAAGYSSAYGLVAAVSLSAAGVLALAYELVAGVLAYWLVAAGG